jgi:hypothetical protein
MSVVMDLDARELYVSQGNPCQHPLERLTFEGLLDKPSPLAAQRQAVTGPTLAVGA